MELYFQDDKLVEHKSHMPSSVKMLDNGHIIARSKGPICVFRDGKLFQTFNAAAVALGANPPVATRDTIDTVLTFGDEPFAIIDRVNEVTNEVIIKRFNLPENHKILTKNHIIIAADGGIATYNILDGHGAGHVFEARSEPGKYVIMGTPWSTIEVDGVKHKIGEFLIEGSL